MKREHLLILRSLYAGYGSLLTFRPTKLSGSTLRPAAGGMERKVCGILLPPVYRQCALLMTDFWEAYKGVLPSKRHFAVGKESGLTNLIERFNCTLRQRCSRLVRKTLSFSKPLENHILKFITHYNEHLAPKLASISAV